MSRAMSFDVVAIAVLALPLVAAVVSMVFGARHACWATRVGASAALSGVLLAAVLAIHVGSGAIVEIDWRSGPGDLLAGLAIDRLTAVFLLLIYGVSAVVACFAVRYLNGDDRAAWFSASAGLLTATTAGAVTSSTLIGLAACWTLSGVALCLLLGTYPSLAPARQGVVRTAAAFAIGDLAFWSAVAIITARVGTVEVSRLGDAMSGQPHTLIGAVSLLMVLAALARSAQVPFHKWLPATLAAPTPASALLHAGVVNGGGVLLVRTGGLVGQSTVAMGVTAVAGGLTMLYGSAAMLTKPDIKGALVHSTRAQMGFMILTCGLGLYAAAVFHLIAHGMYKATLFLNSGSALSQRDRAARRAPAPSTSPARTLLSTTGAMALSGSAVALAVAIVPWAVHPDGVVLLVFGWVTAAALTAGWLRRRPSVRVTAVVTAALTAIAVGYLIAVAGLTGFVADGLPSAEHMPTIWPVVAVITALAVLLTIRWLPVGGRGDRLHHSAYAAALNAGYVGTPKGAFS